MSSNYDASEFVDGDLLVPKSPAFPAGLSQTQRAPSREEVDSKVADAQQKLAELKRAQEDLERERAALEETRRRQMEFQTGRQEMTQQLTRGVGLLEEAEFNIRRDAEQMAKTLVDFRAALTKVQTIREETWAADNFNIELTRALTVLENARMEWNAARLKFPALSEPQSEGVVAKAADITPASSIFGAHSFGELCRLGFALTWPLFLVTLGLLVVLMLRR